MINLKAYKEWKELFSENVSEVWQKESSPVLKKLSMLLFSIKKEIKEIEDEVDKDALKVRQLVSETPKKLDILSDSNSVENTNNNKENIQIKTKIGCLSTRNIPVDKLEILKIREPHLSRQEDSTESIIISDDETANTFTNDSPEIKKKKRSFVLQKRSQRRKLKDGNSATISLLHDLNIHHDNDSGSPLSSQQNDENTEQTNVADENSSMDFFKGLIGHTQVFSDPIKECDKIINGQYSTLTPVRGDCDMDLVQGTPVPISLPKRKDKTTSYLSKKRRKKETTTTLTHILSRNKGKKDEEKSSRLQETNNDSEETYFDASQSTKTSQMSSVLGITRMVSYLNTESPSKERDVPTKMVSQGIINLDPNTQEIADFVEDIRFEDFEDDDDDTSLNSAIIEENEVEKGVPQGLNDLLAKAQNVPKQLEAEPVVRGKARQRLPGWSCKDCEQFYLKQGMNPQDILALNKCSKHRGNFRPREDTVPGFWDMNIVTQETQETT